MSMVSFQKGFKKQSLKLNLLRFPKKWKFLEIVMY
jgi:hypothetical protein